MSPGILSMVLDPKAAGLDPQDKGLHKTGHVVVVIVVVVVVVVVAVVLLFVACCLWCLPADMEC